MKLTKENLDMPWKESHNLPNWQRACAFLVYCKNCNLEIPDDVLETHNSRSTYALLEIHIKE